MMMRCSPCATVSETSRKRVRLPSGVARESDRSSSAAPASVTSTMDTPRSGRPLLTPPSPPPTTPAAVAAVGVVAAAAAAAAALAMVAVVAAVAVVATVVAVVPAVAAAVAAAAVAMPVSPVLRVAEPISVLNPVLPSVLGSAVLSPPVLRVRPARRKGESAEALLAQPSMTSTRRPRRVRLAEKAVTAWSGSG